MRGNLTGFFPRTPSGFSDEYPVNGPTKLMDAAQVLGIALSCLVLIVAQSAATARSFLRRR